MKAPRVMLLACAILAAAAAAHAQQCTPDDTYDTCYAKFNPTAAAQAAANVGATTTSTPTAPTLAAATVLKDFLSVFGTGVDIGQVSTSTNVVTLYWNVPFPFVEDNDKVQFQTLFTDSDLAADVQTALGTNTAAAKSKLTNFDDVTGIASYEPVNARLGRSIAAHTDFLDALNATESTAGARRARSFALLLLAWDKQHPDAAPFSESTKFSTIGDAATQNAFIAQAQANAAADLVSTTKTTKMVTALTQLINNQPQAYASAQYHYRNALVGPDELSFKGTLEISPNSLNAFLKKNADVCKMTGTRTVVNADSCTDRLTAFADANGSVPASDRLSLAITYDQARADSVDLTTYGVVPPNTPIVRASTHSLIYSLGWGRPVQNPNLKNSRIDVGVNYENVSNDPTKRDRFVASVTFSQKLSDSMTLPLSVTYANHAKYLTDPDRKLGIHFGISYKIVNTSGK